MALATRYKQETINAKPVMVRGFPCVRTQKGYHFADEGSSVDLGTELAFVENGEWEVLKADTARLLGIGDRPVNLSGHPDFENTSVDLNTHSIAGQCITDRYRAWKSEQPAFHDAEANRAEDKRRRTQIADQAERDAETRRSLIRLFGVAIDAKLRGNHAKGLNILLGVDKYRHVPIEVGYLAILFFTG